MASFSVSLPELEGYTEETKLVQNGNLDWHGNQASKVTTGGWKACSFIFANELCDRLAFFGITSNLVTYLTTELHETTPTAATNVNNFAGAVFLTPFLGAFIADAYLGRFKTIIVFSLTYLSGLILLTLSVSIDKLKPPKCNDTKLAASDCPKPTSAQVGLLFFCLYLAALGSGGSKPCASSFGGDQFDEADEREKKRKSSFFNWWFFGISFSSLAAVTGLVTVQDYVGWGWGFGIPTVSMSIAIVFFVIGARFYRYNPATGSPLTQVVRVLVAAIRNRNVPYPSDKNSLYEGDAKDFTKPGSRQLPPTQQFKFLERAAIEPNHAAGAPDDNKIVSRWKLCSVTEVEEVKQIARIVPVWLAILPFSIVMSQVNTLFVRQGSTMNRAMGSSRVKIPSAALQVFLNLPVVLCVPLYDRIIVPAIAKYSGNHRGISLLRRIGVGIFVGILGMVAAATTEEKRLSVAESSGLLDHPRTPLPLSIFWLLPQYAILGIAEVFATIGQLEFFYDQAPDSMQSLGTAMFLGNLGVGNFLSGLLIRIVNKATEHRGSWIGDNLNRSHLDKFYWLLGAICLIDLFIYALLASWYTYKNADVQAQPSPTSCPSPEEQKQKPEQQRI